MDRDKLLALIRKETGIKLEADDPVLAVAVLHEKLLEAALERVEAAARSASGHMAMAADRAVETAASEAGRIITESTEWVVEQMRAAGAEVAATLVQETQAEVARAEVARRAAVSAAWVTGGMAAAGVAAIGGLVLAALHVG